MTTFYEDCATMIDGALHSLREDNFQYAKEKLIDLKALMESPYRFVPGDMDGPGERIKQLVPVPDGIWSSYSLRTSPDKRESVKIVAIALTEEQDGSQEIQPVFMGKNGIAWLAESDGELVFHDIEFSRASDVTGEQLAQQVIRNLELEMGRPGQRIQGDCSEEATDS